LLANDGHRIGLGAGIIVGAKKSDVLNFGSDRSRGRGMFLAGHFALPPSGGALVVSRVIDVGIAAEHLAVLQYQDGTNFIAYTIAGSSIQRIEPVLNHRQSPFPSGEPRLERWHQLPHRILTILEQHNETPIAANDNALCSATVFLSVVQYHHGKVVISVDEISGLSTFGRQTAVFPRNLISR
jgi:hypothetical protein